MQKTSLTKSSNLAQTSLVNEVFTSWPRERCVTNADCRLADWQVNEVNIVVKCFNRLPILTH